MGSRHYFCVIFVMWLLASELVVFESHMTCVVCVCVVWTEL